MTYSIDKCAHMRETHLKKEVRFRNAFEERN